MDVDFKGDIVEGQDNQATIKNENDFKPIKTEFADASLDNMNVSLPVPISQGLILISQPVKYEDICDDKKNNTPFFPAQGPVFISQLVKYDNVEDDMKNNRSSCILTDPLLCSQPVKQEEVDNATAKPYHCTSHFMAPAAKYEDCPDEKNYSLYFPQDSVLISKPINYEVFNESFSKEPNNNNSSVENIRVHSVYQIGNNLKYCNYCNHSFKRNYHLTVHLRKHTGEKPYICDECDARFAYRAVLRHHKLVHSGEKPFECNHCGAGFTKKFNLKSHISRMHKRTKFESRDKKFICRVCEAKFVRSSALKLHERKHSSDRPFECPSCEKKFKYKHVLNKHLKTHAAKTSCKSKCDIC